MCRYLSGEITACNRLQCRWPSAVVRSNSIASVDFAIICATNAAAHLTAFHLRCGLPRVVEHPNEVARNSAAGRRGSGAAGRCCVCSSWGGPPAHLPLLPLLLPAGAAAAAAFARPACWMRRSRSDIHHSNMDAVQTVLAPPPLTPPTADLSLTPPHWSIIQRPVGITYHVFAKTSGHALSRILLVVLTLALFGILFRLAALKCALLPFSCVAPYLSDCFNEHVDHGRRFTWFFVVIRNHL